MKSFTYTMAEDKPRRSAHTTNTTPTRSPSLLYRSIKPPNVTQDMQACFTRLKQLVPTTRPNQRLSKVELLQQVIDYILDLENTLELRPENDRKQSDIDERLYERRALTDCLSVCNK